VTLREAAEGVNVAAKPEAEARACRLALGCWGDWSATQVLGNQKRLVATITDKGNRELVAKFFLEVKEKSPQWVDMGN
tara:strand:- start:160 stop:393 length:234 start_codon:yes stop_codon:yes gene_type:complete